MILPWGWHPELRQEEVVVLQFLRRRWKRTLVVTAATAAVTVAFVAGHEFQKIKSNVEALRRHQVWALSSDEWFRNADFNAVNTMLFQLRSGRINYFVEKRDVDLELAEIVNRAPICGSFAFGECVFASQEVLSELLDCLNGAISFHECRLDSAEMFENVFRGRVAQRSAELTWKPISARVQLADGGRLVGLTFKPGEGAWLPGMLDSELTLEFGKDWSDRKRLAILEIRRDGDAILLVGTKAATEPFEGSMRLLWSPAKNISARLIVAPEK